jgi:hypothetical protein
MLKQENRRKNNYHECVEHAHQICRPVVLISASHLRSSFDHLCAETGVVHRVAGSIQIARPVSKKDRHPDCLIDERSGPGPSPAHQHCAHNETRHGRNPQCRHVYRPQPRNICTEGIHTALHTNPPDPEGHAGDAQCEADPVASGILFCLSAPFDLSFRPAREAGIESRFSTPPECLQVSRSPS